MHRDLEEKLRFNFMEILYDLAEFDGRGHDDIDDTKMCLSIYNKFAELYNTIPGDKKFRYYDSDIFIVLSNINNRIYEGDIKYYF